jgi:hypothetical protein
MGVDSNTSECPNYTHLLTNWMMKSTLERNTTLGSFFSAKVGSISGRMGQRTHKLCRFCWSLTRSGGPHKVCRLCWSLTRSGVLNCKIILVRVVRVGTYSSASCLRSSRDSKSYTTARCLTCHWIYIQFLLVEIQQLIGQLTSEKTFQSYITFPSSWPISSRKVTIC